jgi:putative DNA primase/helicase
MPAIIHPMSPEHARIDRAVTYAAALQERFHRRGILAELQVHPHWIIWRQQGEMKVPYNPSEHYQASSKKPETWGSLPEALSALSSGQYSGLGFMLSPDQLPLTLIDLDHCYDKKARQITSPQAQEIVRQTASYTEVSPSGDGLHILAYGTLPTQSGLHTDIEMYDHGRYFTVTTNRIPETPTTIQERQAAITALYQKHRPPGSTSQNTVCVLEQSGQHLAELPPAAKQDQLLQALLQGDTSYYHGDESRADFVLLMKLLHWTGDDMQLTKHLYLASPLGQREKVLEKRGPTTYLDMTLRNVVKKRRNGPMQR